MTMIDMNGWGCDVVDYDIDSDNARMCGFISVTNLVSYHHSQDKPDKIYGLYNNIL